MLSNRDTAFFLIGLCLLCFSAVLHVLNKQKLALFFLFIAALPLFSFAALYYPFLNVWDERFHALVGKNLMHHFLMPTLYDDPVVNMNYHDNWARYHIWLHKQPLFLWQMALSYTLFGVNEFTMRLPNVFLGCAMVYAGYRAGKILGNNRVGYYTALLLVSSPHLMQLLAGRLELDQNDFSFIAYVSLSLWCWLEYVHTRKIYWIFLTGLFSGSALLCKWLVGLLVYFCWVLTAFAENKFRLKNYWDIALSLLVTALVFLPWQILILKWYPAEAKAALQFNIHHFTEASDGHTGSFFYHIDLIPENFGSWTPYLIFPSFFVFYLKTIYKRAAMALIASISAVYLFFTLALTKMPCFTSVIILPFFLSLAFFIDFAIIAFNQLQAPAFLKKGILLCSFFLFLFSRLDLRPFMKDGAFPGRETEQAYRAALSHNKAVFQKLNLPHNAVIFNVKGRHYIEAMYYTGLPAYGFIPSEEQSRDMEHKGRRVALFMPEDGEIPAYLQENKNMILIRDSVVLCE